MAETKRLLHIADYMEYVASHPADSDAAAFAKLTGVRTMLEVPMLKDDDVVGAVVIYRTEVRRFDDREIALVTDFAAQAVIAIENARLLHELRQSLERQTATSEVLQVISSSPGEIEPVFMTMLEKAVHICGAKFGSLYLHESGRLRLVAGFDVEFLEARRDAAFEPAPGGLLDEIMRTKRPAQVADLAATKPYFERHPIAVEAVELGGIRTAVAVPMLKDDRLIGIITIVRQEVRPFTDKQIELVKNFAAQAVIAIENARLLNELRQRTGDLTEALEQQTATSELLQVISSSSGDLEPVFAAMLENAVRICHATFGNIYRVEGDGLRIVATHNTPPVFAEARRTVPYFSPGPKNPVCHMMTTKTVVHVDDVAATEAYADREPAAVASVELGGTRTLMIVPMLKDNELVGACMLARQEVLSFNDKQIELVTNFAAQAVIAIENARLLNELRQSLERQTASAEVLQVISMSPGDLAPVFATMLRKAVSICDAKFGTLYFRQGDELRLIATHEVPTAFAEAQSKALFRPAPGGMLDAVMRSGSTAHLPDLAQARSYIERDPRMVEAVEVGGIRSVVGVPLINDDELIGIIGIYRQEVRPFADKQIELLTNFAAQAVIAIENARLLNELRQRTTDLTERTADLTEALEQQTATSEVLQVISTSPGDLEPVFASMLEKAVRICDAKFGSILRWENEAAHLVATHNAPPAFAEARLRSQNPANPETSFGRMVATKAVVHVADAAAEPGYVELRDPAAVAAVELGRQRTALYVPMLKEGELIGALSLSRQEVRPFTDIFEPSLSLRRLRTTPPRKPRTECGCQPVAFIIASIVAPVGDCSNAMTRDCFEPRSALFGSGSPALCRDDFVVGTAAGADAVGRFFAGFDIEILRSVSRRRAAPPKPHLGDAAGGAGSRGALGARNQRTVPLQWRPNASPFWIMLSLSDIRSAELSRRTHSRETGSIATACLARSSSPEPGD